MRGAILDSDGNAVVEYSYDAWGKLLATTGSMATTLGVHNPLRYRGYVYDNESALYYLQSRYYDPELGRFINADDVDYLGASSNLTSYNLFAYCGNNPVRRIDSNGHRPKGIINSNAMTLNGGSDLAAGLLIGVGVGIALAKQKGKKKPINLPSVKKMKLDLDHITSGHMPDGPRNPKGNKDVFYGLTVPQVVKAIYEAYNTASKLKTQGHNIKLIGFSSSFNLMIEMWIDTMEYVISTAYPK